VSYTSAVPPEAVETLEKKGGLHEVDRKRVKTGTGY
jgi:hypothetical protein